MGRKPKKKEKQMTYTIKFGYAGNNGNESFDGTLAAAIRFATKSYGTYRITNIDDIVILTDDGNEAASRHNGKWGKNTEFGWRVGAHNK
jgi:hypothetical protein